MISVAPEWSKLDEPAGRNSFYTLDHEAAICGWFFARGWQSMHDLILTLSYTGLRLSGALTLDWSLINFDTNSLILLAAHNKAGKDVSLPLCLPIREALLVRWQTTGCPTHGVVFGDLNKARARYRWDQMKLDIDRDGKPLVNLSSIPKADRVMHTCRHTFCSRLAVAGAPAEAIRELAGHSSLLITQRYMHLAPAAHQQAVAVLLPPVGHEATKEAAALRAATQSVAVAASEGRKKASDAPAAVAGSSAQTTDAPA